MIYSEIETRSGVVTSSISDIQSAINLLANHADTVSELILETYYTLTNFSDPIENAEQEVVKAHEYVILIVQLKLNFF